MNNIGKIGFCCLLLSLAACSTQNSKPELSATQAGTDRQSELDVLTKSSLKQLWVAQGFKTPESVLYDQQRNILYVANIDGHDAEKDGLGFISKLSRDGQIVDLEWISGLHAPKGMAVYDGKLYVADITDLVEIDIEKGEIIGRYTNDKAVFLNDVVADAKGFIYASDTRDHKLYRFKDGVLEFWLEAEEIKNPNGLYIKDDSTLLLGASHHVFSIDLQSKAVSSYIQTGIGEITDGLVPNGSGAFFTSDWFGKTWLSHPDRKSALLLDTSGEKVNSADLEYVASEAMLLIPTFLDNKVIAYTVEE